MGSFIFFQKNAEAQVEAKELTGKIDPENPFDQEYDLSRLRKSRHSDEKILELYSHTSEYTCNLNSDGSGRCILPKQDASPTIIEIPKSSKLVGLSANRYRVYFWSSHEMYEISFYNLLEAARKYNVRYKADGIKKISGRHLLTLDGSVHSLIINRSDNKKPRYSIDTRKKIIDIRQSEDVDRYGRDINTNLYLVTEDGKEYISNVNFFEEFRGSFYSKNK